MSNGLIKVGCAITAALNRPEAEADWLRAKEIARKNGNLAEAEKLAPDFSNRSWGIKRIDKQTCRLLKLVGYTKEQTENENFGCWYQWEKAK